VSRDPYELSHDKLRLVGERLSDIDTPRPPIDRPANVSEQAAENGRFRGTKEVLSAPLKAAAGENVRRALGSDATPEESQLVARNALVIAGDVQRDVGVFSPFIAHQVTRFGVNSALAGFYTQKAAEHGFDSQGGVQRLEWAHRCEQQATRAMVAIEAAIRTTTRKRSEETIDLGAAIEAASKERPR
jgi:hypothetical protein